MLYLILKNDSLNICVLYLKGLFGIVNKPNICLLMVFLIYIPRSGYSSIMGHLKKMLSLFIKFTSEFYSIHSPFNHITDVHTAFTTVCLYS